MNRLGRRPGLCLLVVSSAVASIVAIMWVRSFCIGEAFYWSARQLQFGDNRTFDVLYHLRSGAGRMQLYRAERRHSSKWGTLRWNRPQAGVSSVSEPGFALWGFEVGNTAYPPTTSIIVPYWLLFVVSSAYPAFRLVVICARLGRRLEGAFPVLARSDPKENRAQSPGFRL